MSEKSPARFLLRRHPKKAITRRSGGFFYFVLFVNICIYADIRCPALQCSHYVQATEGVDQFGAVYWATEPKGKGMPKEWTPYCPSALEPEDIHLWARGTTSFDQIVVDDIYAQNEKTLENTW